MFTLNLYNAIYMLLLLFFIIFLLYVIGYNPSVVKRMSMKKKKIWKRYTIIIQFTNLNIVLLHIALQNRYIIRMLYL